MFRNVTLKCLTEISGVTVTHYDEKFVGKKKIIFETGRITFDINTTVVLMSVCFMGVFLSIIPLHLLTKTSPHFLYTYIYKKYQLPT